MSKLKKHTNNIYLLLWIQNVIVLHFAIRRRTKRKYNG